MFEINFNLYDHNFCEATIYSTGQHPEYMNAISSLFITFIGLNGMRKIQNNILLSILYACLAVNGIASYYYHYYNSIGYGLLDRMSMVLLALNTSYVMSNSMRMIFNFSVYTNIFLYTSIIIYYSFLLTVAGLHIEWIFNILFALFLFSIIFYMYIIQYYAMSLYYDYNVIKIGWRGAKYILFSALFWIITEALCSKFTFIKYLYGHVFWHIFVSYGGYLVSIVPYYINNIHRYGYTSEIVLSYDIFWIPYIKYVH